MTNKQFQRTFSELVAAYPQREIPTATQLVYWQHLREMDDGLFIVAAKHCRETLDWFPTIRQILAAADLWAARVHGIRTPDEAWELVAGLARDWHDGMSVRMFFEPVEFDALQRIGGIRTVALADEIGIAAKRRDFMLAYKRMYDERVTEARALPLPNPQLTALPDGRAA